MSSNPYITVRQKKDQRQPMRVPLLLVQVVFVVVIILSIREPLSIYLLSNTSQRLEQLLLRTSALLVALMALQTYTGIVRHPERNIFGVHPILSVPFLYSVALEQVKGSLLWWLTAVGIWSAVSMSWFPWILLCLTSAWIGGIGVGYGVHLGSVWAARSPNIAPVLDMLRGQNPKEQAAFIYAPGVALGLMGLSLLFSTGATRLVIEGQHKLAPWILLPLGVGVVGWLVALRLAPTYLLRASMILVDIDAHWNSLEDGDQEDGVYLDWLATDKPHRLRLLRNSWRLHRWVTYLAWSVGGLSALFLWLEDLVSALVLCGAASIAFLFFPMLLSKSEPKWLQWSLGISDAVQRKALTEVSILIWMSVGVPVLFMLVWLGLPGFSLLFVGSFLWTALMLGLAVRAHFVERKGTLMHRGIVLLTLMWWIGMAKWMGVV